MSDKRKFEAGYQSELENSDDISELYLLDTLTNQYQYQSLFSNSVKYKNNDQAFYATYSDEFGNFGLQGGLRTEYTFRTISCDL